MATSGSVSECVHSPGVSEHDPSARFTGKHDEHARSGRRVVCARCSAKDCSGLGVVHAFLQLPYFQLVQRTHEEAIRVASEAMTRAEASVRAVANGEEPAGSSLMTEPSGP